MSSIRVAVHMQPQRDENGHTLFRAALPMGVWFEKSLDKQELETARVALEENYRALVESLRAMRPTLKEGNTLQNWMFGDEIVRFEQETARTLLFVDKLSDNLARDVEYSKTMIDLCRRFRIKLADRHLVDPHIPFHIYHRNGFDLQRIGSLHRK